MAITQAIGKIRGLASSYWSNPLMLRARSTASSLANNPNVRRGAYVGAMAGAVAGFPSWIGDYNRNRNMGRGKANSYARASVSGWPLTGASAVAGAAGYAGYKAMGGYGGVKSSAMRYGARAARGAGNMISKVANFIA